MEGQQEFVDFIAFLPEELWENILCRLIDEPLSNVDFTNCRLVCKNWNERISSNTKLWKVACQKRGLDVNEDTEEDYIDLFLRKRKRLLKIKNGSEVFCVEDFKFPDQAITAMCYHNGIVAIGCGDSIHMLKLEPNLRVVSRVDLGNRGRVDCIHFDDSYLVVGISRGYVITFEMPTMKRLHITMQSSDLIQCVTFDKGIDLLVIATKKDVTFLCLSSGTVHFARTFDDFMMTFHLVPAPNLQNGCDYMLLCAGLSSFCGLLFDSQQITTAQVNPISSCDRDRSYDEQLDEYDCSYFRFPFLYYVRQLSYSLCSIIMKYDCASHVFEEILQVDCLEATMVGVGKKYACILHETMDGPGEVIIYDLATESRFASFKMPEHLRQVFGNDPYACLVNGRFLDGFDGFNDNGVILVGQDSGSIYVVKWRK